MRYYASKNSKEKTFHLETCRYAAGIDQNRRIYFPSISYASRMGYRHCRYCAPVMKYVNKRREEIEDYCKKNSLHTYFEPQDGTLTVISKSGTWKIAVFGKDRSNIRLLHKSTQVGGSPDPRSSVKGYHLQWNEGHTIMAHLAYIVRHDNYRERNPLYKPAPDHLTRKQKKKRRQHEERVRRKQQIAYVDALLEEVSRGNVKL